MINRLLNAFMKQYYGQIVVRPEYPDTIDITSCFQEQDSTYSAPRSYGELPDNRVLAYIVKGAPLAPKYLKDDQGKVVFDQGKPVVRPLDDATKAIACLCVADMKNTTFHEIYDALQGAETIQGYTQRHIERIEQRLKKYVPTFQAENDTAFIFAGEMPLVADRLDLHFLWLGQLRSEGNLMLRHIYSGDERYLIGRVFPEAVRHLDADALRKRSYMYGRKGHIPESIEFLQRKMEAYRDDPRAPGN